MELGTVVSTLEGPSPSTFDFVAKDGAKARRGQFISLETGEGTLIGRITDIKKTNQYFARPDSVREYEKQGSVMDSIFPTGRWEYSVASVKPLGVYSNNLLQKPSFPPSPGTKVYLAPDEMLSKFLGMDEKGILLGTIEHHNLEVKLNLTRLLQKHLAVLAMSGAGKSYLTGVLIEELLERPKKFGRVGVLIIDVHGEYTGFSEIPEPGSGLTDYSSRCKRINGDEIKIGVPNLGVEDLNHFIRELTPIQKRDLGKIISQLQKKQRAGEGTYNLVDIAKAVEKDEDIKSTTKEGLANWLLDLNKSGLFADIDYPSVKSLIKPGFASIIDLGEIIGIKKKQIIVSYLLNELFHLRRQELVAPFLVILEESHQFVPEGTKTERALAKSILETIAREGRKFQASLCLISQRPKRLSTTVLSQCNTHLILRVTNPYDLDHIKQSSERITQDTLDSISSLPVGEGLVVGEAVNCPIFVKIRKRKSLESSKGAELEKAALKYEVEHNNKEKDADAFM